MSVCVLGGRGCGWGFYAPAHPSATILSPHVTCLVLLIPPNKSRARQLVHQDDQSISPNKTKDSADVGGKERDEQKQSLERDQKLKHQRENLILSQVKHDPENPLSALKDDQLSQEQGKLGWHIPTHFVVVKDFDKLINAEKER